MKTSLTSCLLFMLLVENNVIGDYYWREYSGIVPHDAITGGRTHNGVHVYIGQVYLKDQGIMVAEIFNGTMEVESPMGGVQKRDKYIKILCGHQNKLKWLPTTAATLNVDTTGKHVILGGHEDAFGKAYIGRVNLEGSVKIGKVNAFSYENSGFHFVQNHEEKLLHRYEVLYCNDDHRLALDFDEWLDNLQEDKESIKL